MLRTKWCSLNSRTSGAGESTLLEIESSTNTKEEELRDEVQSQGRSASCMHGTKAAMNASPSEDVHFYDDCVKRKVQRK